MVRVFSVYILLTFFSINSFAQIPAGYYDGANGKTGDELKTELNDINRLSITPVILKYFLYFG